MDTRFLRNDPNENGLSYFDIRQHPDIVFGLPWFQSTKKFCRLPPKKLSLFSEEIQDLAWNTSGGRLRFRTDSSKVVLKVKMLSKIGLPKMPRLAYSGFDIYQGCKNGIRYVTSIVPDNDLAEYFGELHGNGSADEWLIYLPLFNGIKSLQIGIVDGSLFEPASQYNIPQPIAFYGSSITQGGCVSRIGNAYFNLISRWLDADIYNFGFSGNAKGDPEIARLISGLDISVLVMEYDHNAPTIEHLQATHEPFFRIIRDQLPDLPVIFLSKPDYDAKPIENAARRDIIRQTCLNARIAGDAAVYFIDGELLFGTEDRDCCTVDGCHPNDLGFLRMAKVICPVIREALSRAAEGDD